MCFNNKLSIHLNYHIINNKNITTDNKNNNFNDSIIVFVIIKKK